MRFFLILVCFFQIGKKTMDNCSLLTILHSKQFFLERNSLQMMKTEARHSTSREDSASGLNISQSMLIDLKHLNVRLSREWRD